MLAETFGPPFLFSLILSVAMYALFGFFTALLVSSPPQMIGFGIRPGTPGPRILTLLAIFWPLTWAGAIVCAMLWFFWKVYRAVVHNKGWDE